MKKTNVLLLLIICILMIGIICCVVSKRVRDGSEQSKNVVSGKTNVIHAEYKPGDDRASILDDFTAVHYSYTMDCSDSGAAQVDLMIEFQPKNTKCSAKLVGKVEQIKLPSGFVFWEGPLDGVFIVDGEEVPVVAGFSKKDNEKDICLTITFSVGGDKEGKYPLVLTVGEGFITDEINEEIKSIHKNSTEDTSPQK